MKISPQFVLSLDTDLKVITENTWRRVLPNLVWDRLMSVVPASDSFSRVMAWMLTTAKLYPEGRGGNTRFDDMVLATHTIENTNAGAGLRLTRNELEDNQMGANPQVATLDWARQWAEQIGNAAAFYPEQQLFALIAAGTTATGYDGVSFFNAAHPLNPNGGGGTYSNIITGVSIATGLDADPLKDVALAQANFAKALAAVSAQKFLGGIPRYLRPTVMFVPTALQYRAEQVTGARTVGLTENVLVNRNIEVVVNPLLDSEPTVYYLGVADMLSDDLAPFLWWERQPFELRGYSLADEANLSRKDEFEWHMKGRNAAAYGHPYLFYRCTA